MERGSEALAALDDPPPLEGASRAALQDVAYWQAANYLAVGALYLQGNPLLREPLQPGQLKPRPSGTFAPAPAVNLVYAQLNRWARHHRQAPLLLAGVEAAPAVLANLWLAGDYATHRPGGTRDAPGMLQLFRSAELPLGLEPALSARGASGALAERALAEARGAPGRLVLCLLGEEELADAGPTWLAARSLDRRRDGTLLPVLCLDGWRPPGQLAAVPGDALPALLEAQGLRCLLVAGREPVALHAALAQALERATQRLEPLPSGARDVQPLLSVIVLRTPAGFGLPPELEAALPEQLLALERRPATGWTDPRQLALLRDWLLGYEPELLFDEAGGPRPELRLLAPEPATRVVPRLVEGPGSRHPRQELDEPSPSA